MSSALHCGKPNCKKCPVLESELYSNYNKYIKRINSIESEVRAILSTYNVKSSTYYALVSFSTVFEHKYMLKEKYTLLAHELEHIMDIINNNE